MRLDEIVSTVFTIGALALILVSLTNCTQMEFYAGMRRMDTIKTETTASDGNFLCGVMGYCREGENKRP
jgi:hypothetical protein